MAVTTAIGSISNIVKEELSFVKKECEPEVDGFFSKLYTTSNGVSQGIGRSWQVIQTFSTGVAGAFKNVAAAGGATLDVDSTGQSHMWNASQRTFPTVAQQSAPGYVQKTLTLVEGMGVFTLPFHYFQANKIDGSIADAVSLTIKGTAKQVAQAEANSFYENDTTKKAIWQITSGATVATAVTTNGAQTTVHAVDDGTHTTGRIGRLLPGMIVQGCDDSASGDAVLTNADYGVVTKVDYVGKTFSVFWTGGAVTFAASDYITQAGDEFSGEGTLGPSGAETWLVNSGSPFGISLTTHPQFKSLIGAVNAVLDESTLNKYVGGFFDAYGAMYTLDSVLTTTGVLTAYMESIDGLYRYARNNERLTLKEGWASMDYAYNGDTFEILASRYQKPGQAYIMKTRDQNLKRYVPPSVDGTKSQGGFPGDIQFVAPWMGSSTIFKPAHISSATSEFAEAPFVCFREWCPDQLPGIKLTGLTELNP